MSEVEILNKILPISQNVSELNNISKENTVGAETSSSNRGFTGSGSDNASILSLLDKYWSKLAVDDPGLNFYDFVDLNLDHEWASEKIREFMRYSSRVISLRTSDELLGSSCFYDL